MIPTEKQQKPVLRDLTKFSELISSRVGTHMQVFYSQVQQLTVKANSKCNAVKVEYDHLLFLEC